MPLFLPENITKEDHFSSSLPGFQTAWDSTSLGLIKECPRKYYYSSVLGLRHNRTKDSFQPNPHLKFGILYHRGHEHYEKAKAAGMPHEEALTTSLQAVLSEAGQWEIEIYSDDNGAPFSHYSGTYDKEEALTQALDLYPEAEYVARWLPFEASDDLKTTYILMQALVFYYEHYRNDPAKTLILADGSPALELSFNFPIPSDLTRADEPILMCGHLDRVVEFLEKIWVVDYKTSKTTMSTKYFNGYSPGNQMSLYTFGSQIVLGEPASGVMIDGVQVAKGFARFARGFAPRSRANLSEWFEDFNTWLKIAYRFAEEGNWPQNDTACSKFAGCQFRNICANSPAARERYIRSDFHQEYWRPLEAR